MDKLIELETSLSFLENEFAKLSGRIYRQQQEILELKDSIANMQNKLDAIKLSEINTEDKPPPHY